MTSICVHMLLFFLILGLWMESTSAEDEPTATEENCKPNCWSEAMDNIFRNDQCPQIDGCWGTVFRDACKNKWGTSLEACKKKCQQTMNCNAFNYRPNKLCVLRACPFPVPEPLGQKKEVKGYFITGSGDTWEKEKVDKIENAIKSTLANPPSARDTTSERSTIIQSLGDILIRDMNRAGVDTKSRLYKIFKNLFLKIVEDPKLEDYFPNFSSRFQSGILPTVIQKEDLNSPLLKSKLKTPFPKEVEDSAQLENKEVTINGTYVDECPWGGQCTHLWKSNWISTHLYAKQGQMVTVTVPEHMVGKFGIRVNAHTDFVCAKYMQSWKRGNTYPRPGIVTQYYKKEIIKQKTKLLTPYGGLIFIDIGLPPVKLGEFTLQFENVITSLRFKQGETTSEEWPKALASSKSPMVELEVPGLLMIIPSSYVVQENINIPRAAGTATKLMNAIHKMHGYVLPRPNLYVYDDGYGGAAHSGYPIVDTYLRVALKNLENGHKMMWSMPHEIGHTLEYPTYTPGGMTDVINNIFSQYVNIEALKVYPNNLPSLDSAIKFREGDKKFSSLNLFDKLNILLMIQQECSWQTFISFFKFYNEEIPMELKPKNNNENYSLITRVLSEKCNKNLIPFFQWWNWPVLDDTVEATKNLPEWEGIIVTLESGARRSRVPRVWSGIVQTKIWSKQQCSTNGVRRGTSLEKCKKLCQEKSSCNAIHFNGFSCVFVKCPQHVPPPQGQNGKYKGYYILDPNDNYTWLQTKLSDPEAEWKESNTDSYGIDVDSKKVNGENECADWCGTTRGCYFWTLREKDNLCWLKTTIAGLYYHTVKRSGFTSGDKLCASEDALKTG